MKKALQASASKAPPAASMTFFTSASENIERNHKMSMNIVILHAEMSFRYFKMRNRNWKWMFCFTRMAGPKHSILKTRFSFQTRLHIPLGSIWIKILTFRLHLNKKLKFIPAGDSLPPNWASKYAEGYLRDIFKRRQIYPCIN